MLTVQAYPQLGKEAWHWQFGKGVSLDFSSGIPVVSTSRINTLEGCASISDPNTGQLLFYTDGTSVWDRNTNQMPNGYGMMGGYGTSTQAALIIPKSCGSSFYLISADQGGYDSTNIGVHYSLIDMSLNGGFGDVVPSSKNILLTPPPTTEKLVGVKHTNGLDYWIITHPFFSNNFNAYLASSSGINLNPVVSSVGTVLNNISGDSVETIGYLKASPDGKKLASAIYSSYNLVELYDFDASTGIVSNPIFLHLDSLSGPYGVSFSPDNTKLYVTTTSYINSDLLQYDLSSGIAATIIASQQKIQSNIPLNALQLAPNGKIYAAEVDFIGSISVINNPNALGVACNFQSNIIYFPDYTWCSEFGLPNFIDGGVFISDSLHFTLSKSKHIDTVCDGSAIILEAGNNFKKYLWSTGDITQTIKINKAGVYTVKCIADTSQCFKVDTFKYLFKTLFLCFPILLPPMGII